MVADIIAASVNPVENEFEDNDVEPAAPDVELSEDTYEADQVLDQRAVCRVPAQTCASEDQQSVRKGKQLSGWPTLQLLICCTFISFFIVKMQNKYVYFLNTVLELYGEKKLIKLKIRNQLHMAGKPPCRKTCSSFHVNWMEKKLISFFVSRLLLIRPYPYMKLKKRTSPRMLLSFATGTSSAKFFNARHTGLRMQN